LGIEVIKFICINLYIKNSKFNAEGNAMEFSITANLNKGEASLCKGKIRIAYVKFLKDHDRQITVTDVTVESRYRRKGYGTMLMSLVMAYARLNHQAIFLYSLSSAIEFYEFLGFKRLKYYKDDPRVRFANLNPDKNFDEQIEENDFLWIPPELEKVSIFL